MNGRGLVIFGTGLMAEVASFYFQHDSAWQVGAFVVDDEYVTSGQFAGHPVVPTTSATAEFPPDAFDAFVAVGYSRRNTVRREKFEMMKHKGYRMATYLSSRSTIWMPERIGENCFILEDNTVQPFVTVGDNCVLWSGNHIGHHSSIGAHTFVASHAVISGSVKIGEQCFVGVNATLRDSITVGDRCIIGAGALVMADCEPDGLYVGTPTVRSAVPSGRVRL
jgi:sugar O-acyltransferase (sialic acid O-acetyltransferase NeuD family)